MNSRANAAGLAVLFCASIAPRRRIPRHLSARKWRQAHEQMILQEFVNLLAIPNLASDSPNIQQECGRLFS